MKNGARVGIGAMMIMKMKARMRSGIIVDLELLGRESTYSQLPFPAPIAEVDPYGYPVVMGINGYKHLFDLDGYYVGLV